MSYELVAESSEDAVIEAQRLLADDLTERYDGWVTEPDSWEVASVTPEYEELCQCVEGYECDYCKFDKESQWD
jgi:hypothetical protein